ncbi:cyclic nucleotide-binding domain-containing protein [Bradymonadaceae bacterium TMQ3]|uniref:Cyclic nucleotide-binding domain-containing protein n=2 Tax=Lujinxingia sediminis TaxID=2480984 RepID=A0ABY0CT59_9DELT|nr:cyclic nucleotide-binding domain-containing protein [Bradymonadaceae bacterium TMQ3]RVU44140.1 cyclic nucleotide-binding domain-containing protein [Lujinxingia sediminis]TXC76322.1 cyclic nucleotide-binding domain-containing protein [Bradymonadales bacterium TMQ1]
MIASPSSPLIPSPAYGIARQTSGIPLTPCDENTMTEKIAETIQESPLFKHLSEADVKALISASDLKIFQPGERIIAEAQAVDHLYIVLTGRIRVWTLGPAGEVELKTMGPGAYFGEVSLMSGNTATATVEVKTGPAQVVALRKEALLAVVERDEKIRKMLQGVTLARAKDTIGKVFK